MPSERMYSIASTASVAIDMLRSFESIQIRSMISIGGGIPDDQYTIRPGVIIVGCSVKKRVV